MGTEGNNGNWMKMNDSQEWPPPPCVPDSLNAHDKFLTNLLRAPANGPPMSRMRLYRALQKQTGMKPGPCWLLVRAYCERQGIFPSVRGLRLWLLVLPSLTQIGASILLIVSQMIFARKLAAAHTRHVRIFILHQELQQDGFFLGLILVALLFSLIMAFAAARRARRDAEDARQKVSL
jgi:hypothetical protein